MRLEDAAPETRFRSVWLRHAECGSDKIGPMARHNKAKSRRESCYSNVSAALTQEEASIDVLLPWSTGQHMIQLAARKLRHTPFQLLIPEWTLSTKTRRRAGGNSGRILGSCESTAM
ncbi:hypothetical protein CI238_05353 [Colletotrichum incanum]|uniref:Uncharacterized protein n=1 Tax=Colletotrichum incanum TaxID=1573173 RepID=A0A167CPI1_COLIC|nr:hypothetical protein CI238_05353 [Colletotrichum incanum]